MCELCSPRRDKKKYHKAPDGKTDIRATTVYGRENNKDVTILLVFNRTGRVVAVGFSYCPVCGKRSEEIDETN